MNRFVFSSFRLSTVILCVITLFLSGCNSTASTSPTAAPTSADPATQPTSTAPAIITQNIEISGVKGIELSVSSRLLIDFGDTESLTVETDETVLPNLESKVEDGMLRLGVKPNQNINPTKLEYRLTLKSLESITIQGSGKVTVTGFASPSLKADIQGSGSIQITGKTETLEVVVDGSGSFSGKDLTCANAKVEISGSGKIQVSATDTLEAEVSGSGKITYYGDPKVTESVSGSGSITKG